MVQRVQRKRLSETLTSFTKCTIFIAYFLSLQQIAMNLRYVKLSVIAYGPGSKSNHYDVRNFWGDLCGFRSKDMFISTVRLREMPKRGNQNCEGLCHRYIRHE